MDDYNTDSMRILEIGCGMALSSLLLNKRLANITATDYHPEVKTFLQRNVSLNNDREIDFERFDWESNNDSLGLFDLIIGSDILYDNYHIEVLPKFIDAHSNPRCEVIIVDPGRGRKNKLGKKMQNFGYSLTVQKPTHTNYLDHDFNGHILKFKR